MRPVLFILLAVLLASCKGSAIPGSDGWLGGGPSTVSMDAAAWDFRYGTGISGHPNAVASGGFSFDFPTSGDVDYLTTNVNIAATQYASATVTVTVLSGMPNFIASDGCSPAAARIMLEVVNDELGTNQDGSPRNEDGRWWARLNGPPLWAGAGTYTMNVSLSDLTQWSNVINHLASDRPAQFHATMANLGAVGLTFGACSFGHGVSTSNGTARMTVTAFSVN